jgi:DNA-directed RNA polymerase subunit alpha
MAIACFDAVLRSDPTHAKAQLYKRDCEASLTMYYDETQERKDDKLQQTLRVPITDFELSVRARNCLTKMNIKYLGDLVRKTEAELLSYKNFGETSLNEIKAILTSKNLRLGMLPAEKTMAPPPDHGTVDPAIYSKPIGELDLSVRSRRTMEALNIRLVGELLQHSAEELLAQPNFGQTSLSEIRAKLRTLGVDLRDGRNLGAIEGSVGAADLDEDLEDELLDDEDELEDEELDSAEDDAADEASDDAEKD